MSYGIQEFFISLLVFPITISPYLYIRIVRGMSVDRFRNDVVLASFKKFLERDEVIYAVSKNGSYANMLVYLTSVPISILVPFVYGYIPIMLLIILCYLFNASQMVNNFCTVIVTTNRCVYAYSNICARLTVYKLDAITSIRAVGHMRSTKVEVNGSILRPHLEVENADELIASVYMSTNRNMEQGDAAKQ